MSTMGLDMDGAVVKLQEWLAYLGDKETEYEEKLSRMSSVDETGGGMDEEPLAPISTPDPLANTLAEDDDEIADLW